MANRRVTLETDKQSYDLELTPALENNLTQLGRGLMPSSPWLQIHDEEWLNMSKVISYQFTGRSSQVIDDSSGGHVYEVEPELVAKAREAGETLPPAGGGDMA